MEDFTDKFGVIKPEMLRKISEENASRDKLHMNTHIRQVALERALLEKGVLSEQDIENQLVIVVKEVAQQVADTLGIDVNDLKVGE